VKIGKPLVLVVDDDDDLRDVVASFMDLIDVDTAQAENGRTALEVTRERHPDVILLDMKMPVMDGWAFCRALDASGLRRPPIVVMTAAPDPSVRAAEVGAQAWIGKPFECDELLAVVRRFLPEAR
jgi:CheY-like chemotaxis protein